MIKMVKGGGYFVAEACFLPENTSAKPFLASTIGMNMMIAAAALTQAIAIPTHSP